MAHAEESRGKIARSGKKGDISRKFEDDGFCPGRWIYNQNMLQADFPVCFDEGIPKSCLLNWGGCA